MGHKAAICCHAELADPTCGDLAHWLHLAGLSRWAAIVAAGDALARAAPAGELAGLPERITLSWTTEGTRRVYRIDWEGRG